MKTMGQKPTKIITPRNVIATGLIITTAFNVSCAVGTNPKHHGDQSPRRFSSSFRAGGDIQKQSTPPKTKGEHASNPWTLKNLFAWYKNLDFKVERETGCKPVERYHPDLKFKGGVPYVNTTIAFRGNETELRILKRKVDVISETGPNDCGTITLKAEFPLKKFEQIESSRGVINVGSPDC